MVVLCQQPSVPFQEWRLCGDEHEVNLAVKEVFRALNCCSLVPRTGGAPDLAFPAFSAFLDTIV